MGEKNVYMAREKHTLTADSYMADAYNVGDPYIGLQIALFQYLVSTKKFGAAEQFYKEAKLDRYYVNPLKDLLQASQWHENGNIIVKLWNDYLSSQLNLNTNLNTNINSSINNNNSNNQPFTAVLPNSPQVLHTNSTPPQPHEMHAIPHSISTTTTTTTTATNSPTNILHSHSHSHALPHAPPSTFSAQISSPHSNNNPASPPPESLPNIFSFVAPSLNTPITTIPPQPPPQLQLQLQPQQQLQQLQQPQQPERLVDNVGQLFAETSLLNGGVNESNSTSVNSNTVEGDTNATRFTCTHPGCNKSFSTSAILKRHIKEHSGQKPFVCNVEGCTKRFARKYDLKVHMRSHTGEKPYICTFPGCERKFSRSSDLRLHERIHKGDKPFICDCDGCRKRFVRYADLKKHKRTHEVHEGQHPHVHGAGCGHTAIAHEDHIDYLHDNHLHNHHHDHIDDHTIAVTTANPDGCKPTFVCGHHQHDEDCGHELVPHFDHFDFLVDGRLHYVHDSHCDDHGWIDVIDWNPMTSSSEKKGEEYGGDDEDISSGSAGSDFSGIVRAHHHHHHHSHGSNCGNSSGEDSSASSGSGGSSRQIAKKTDAFGGVNNL